MEKKYLRKVLAGIGIAGLVASSQMMGPTVGVADGASGWGGKKGSAVSTDENAPEKTAEKATAEKEKKSDATGSSAEQKDEEAAPKKAPGKSGWSGSK